MQGPVHMDRPLQSYSEITSLQNYSA